jgi:hypothetical protein
MMKPSNRITKFGSLSLTGSLFLLAGCPYLFLQPIPVHFSGNDVTAFVENLGNPYEEMYPSGEFVYARNIWDMVAFEGFLYIGAGNSSNSAPARNAGPVPIIRYSPASAEWEEMLVVDDEQIDVFYEFDGQLYTPGHDPKEPWDYGNFYRLEANGEWAKYRNIPDGVHNYAMARHDDKLFSGLGLPLSAGVGISSDLGATWANQAIPNDRIYAFLSVGHNLFATGAMSAGAAPAFDGMFEYNGQNAFFSRPDLRPVNLFPDFEFDETEEVKVYRPVNLGRKAIYMGAYIHNDHQADPFGVYVASALERDHVRVRPVDLPTNARPWDLLVHEDRVYLLADLMGGDDQTSVVLVTDHLKRFREVLRFSSDAFARSFAVLDGDFYFGLGSEIRNPVTWTQSELLGDTGKILRVRGQHFDL